MRHRCQHWVFYGRFCERGRGGFVADRNKQPAVDETVTLDTGCNSAFLPDGMTLYQMPLDVNASSVPVTEMLSQLHREECKCNRARDVTAVGLGCFLCFLMNWYCMVATACRLIFDLWTASIEHHPVNTCDLLSTTL